MTFNMPETAIDASTIALKRNTWPVLSSETGIY